MSSETQHRHDLDTRLSETVYTNAHYGKSPRQPLEHQRSIVDSLLFDIYDKWHASSHRDSFESDTFTEGSVTSDAWPGTALPTGSYQLELEERHSNRLNKAFLKTKDIAELKRMVIELKQSVTQSSTQLIRHLKRKDQRLVRFHRHCDIITAIIQAISLKRQIDTRMKFTLQPLPGDIAYTQWLDAMKAVARLPLGIPPEFRKKIWLSLADHHIETLKIDWEKTLKLAFNDRSNPDDDALGMQIVKDLHRTGCNGFTGQDNEQDRALLKRVLLAYARWNKSVGYCQGFNIIAAMILEAVHKREDHALKVMIYLIDHVLPESYFCNNLQALSVDMAVFRDLLVLKLPRLSARLDQLQQSAMSDVSGGNYEPPLTNVFTMQWFLTLFATCLPKATVLRLWDTVLLEGSEVLLRASLAIWGKLARRIMKVQDADEFYSEMGVLTRYMLEHKLVTADGLMKMVYSMASFPFPHLDELREKYTYNITPFQAALNAGKMSRGSQGQSHSIFSDEEDDIDMDQITCFTGMFPPQGPIERNTKGDLDASQKDHDISGIGPGAFGLTSGDQVGTSRPSGAYQERMCTDLSLLKKQYVRLRERQKQAHIILAAASAQHHAKQKSSVAKIESPPIAINHLFISKTGLGGKNKCVAMGPRISSSTFEAKKVYVQSSRRSRSESTASNISSISINSTTSTMTQNTDDTIRTNSSSENESNSSLQIQNVDAKDVLKTEQLHSGLRENSFESSEYSGAVSPDDAQSQSSIETLDSDLNVQMQSDETDSQEAMLPIELDDSAVMKQEAMLPIELDDSDVMKQEAMLPIELDDSGSAVMKQEAMLPIELDDSAVMKQTSDEYQRNDHEFKDKTNEIQNNVRKVTEDFDLCDTVKAVSINTEIVEKESAYKSKDEVVPVEKGEESVDRKNNIEMLGGLLQKEDKTSVKYLAKENNNNRRKLIGMQIGAQGFSPPKGKPNIIPVCLTSINNGCSKKSSSHLSPKSSISKSPPMSCSSPPVSPSRIFNPFPSRHINKHLADNGKRLGMYTKETVHALTNAQKPVEINRSCINKSLHRQYMADVKKERKSNKQ